MISVSGAKTSVSEANSGPCGEQCANSSPSGEECP